MFKFDEDNNWYIYKDSIAEAKILQECHGLFLAKITLESMPETTITIAPNFQIGYIKPEEAQEAVLLFLKMIKER